MLTLQRQKEAFIPATPETGGKQNTWFFGIVRRKYGARLLKATKKWKKTERRNTSFLKWRFTTFRIPIFWHIVARQNR